MQQREGLNQRLSHLCTLGADHQLVAYRALLKCP